MMTAADMTGSKHHITMLHVCLIVPVILATLVRTAPLIEGGERLQRQCVSEDGYLMLTLARNLALGRGLSVSDGLIPSNGSQPLSTLLFSLCFVVAGGDKLLSLYPIVGLQVAGSLLTAALLYLLINKYLYRGPHRRVVALLAAAVWYVSPTSIMHTQNGLETGLYALLILVSISTYDAMDRRLALSTGPGACLLLGAVLGIAFLGRNDACFLIAALLGVQLYRAYRRGFLRRGLIQAFVIGAASVLTATPWLWYNVSRFGHVVPVSGRAESLDVPFGHNLLRTSVAMTENILLFFRIPLVLETTLFAAIACWVFLLVVVALAVRWRRWLAERFSAGVGVLAIFVTALLAFYGLFFGMPCFLGRYLFPAFMLSAIVGSGVIVAAATVASRWSSGRPLAAVGISAAVICIGLDARIYLKGREHLHFQVVNWVTQNVPDETWVAAVQTGTLGYYHNRTINLDGKVDPYALAACRQGRTQEYLLQRNCEYIVDWVGIAQWAQLPTLQPHFILAVEDHQQNLAVLRRIDQKEPTNTLSESSIDRRQWEVLTTVE